MRLKAIKEEFFDALCGLYEKEEINNFFFLLTEAYYDVKRIDLAMHPEKTVEDTKPIFDALEQLKHQKPIQYILGDTEFYGLKFKVNPNVLIPRPETEALVSWILSCYSGRSEASETLNILDIGTGSGCIAIALAKNLPQASVYALDVSAEALEVAKYNAKKNNVNITLIQDDILNPCHAELVTERSRSAASRRFDIIVSNPPYVREQEKSLMQPNVLENEPHVALFVKNDNALVFYESISKFAKKHLKENGQLFFEINEFLGKDTVALLKQYDLAAIELRQDIFGKDRMVKGIYKS